MSDGPASDADLDPAPDAAPDPAEDGVPCLWMRGGTSKGGFFLASDLPSDPGERDALLLRVMGSPDPRQIDGMGGADPLTSKVAVLSRSADPEADVDYLFLQVFVDQALVSDAQTCGNILAAVGPAAIEMGLVPAQEGATLVRIRMANSGEIAEARVETPGGRVRYRGEAAIDGVPGRHAPVALMFRGIAGAMCGALLPTGNPVDVIEGVACTLIDNGMPSVVAAAADLGVTGYETREEMEAASGLKARLEAIRLRAGPLMNLGDVAAKSVPKMVLVAPPRAGGAISTRSFIPRRCHASIGVLGAVTAATACTIPGTPAAASARPPAGGVWLVEHPSGAAEVALEIDETGAVTAAGSVRTARKLFAGRVFPVPA